MKKMVLFLFSVFILSSCPSSGGEVIISARLAGSDIDVSWIYENPLLAEHWGASMADITYTLSYGTKLGSDHRATFLLADQEIGNLTGGTYTLEGLTPGQTYYVQIDAMLDDTSIMQSEMRAVHIPVGE